MTFAVSGTGHAAMECAIFNAVEPRENVVAAVNGIWGERAAEMAARIGKANAMKAKTNGQSWCIIIYSSRTVHVG